MTFLLADIIGYAMSLLKDLTWYFQEAEPQAKKSCLVRSSPQNWSFRMGIIELVL